MAKLTPPQAPPILDIAAAAHTSQSHHPPPFTQLPAHPDRFFALLPSLIAARPPCPAKRIALAIFRSARKQAKSTHERLCQYNAKAHPTRGFTGIVAPLGIGIGGIGAVLCSI